MFLYSRQQARHSLLHTIRFRAVSQIATVLGYVVLVRAMKEQAFGVYNLFYSFIPVITTLASLGLEQTLRRFQPEYLRADRSAASVHLVKLVAAGRLASTLVMLGAVLLAWNVIAPRFHIAGYRADFVIFGVLAILYLQSAVLQISLASYMLHRYSVGSAAAISVAKLLAYLAIGAFGALTLRAAIVADILAYALGCAILVVAHRRFATEARAIRAFEPPERGRLVRYALFNYVNDASSVLVYGQADNFFIGAMLSPIAVAAYAFYSRLIDMMSNLIPQRLFDNVIQPLFYSVPCEEADARLPRYFTLLIDLNLALQLPAIAFAAVYHREVIEVFFAGKYLAYSSLLPIVLTLSIVPVGMSVPLSLVAQYHERTGLMLASELFGLYQVGAMLVLVPALGLYGAALSSGSFHALRNGWIWWRLRQRVRWRNAWGVTRAGLLVWGSVALTCAGLRGLLVGLAPSTHVAIGVAVFGLGALAYLRSTGLSESDRAILAAILHGREGRILRWLGLAPRALPQV